MVVFGVFTLFLALNCSYLEDLGTGVEKSPAVLSGTVRDSLTGLPLPGVALNCAGLSAVTDDQGRFRFATLYSGEKDLTASLPDYRPVSRKVAVSTGGAELDLMLPRANRPPFATPLFPNPAKGKHPLSIRFKTQLSDPDLQLSRSKEILRYSLWLDTARPPALFASGFIASAPVSGFSFLAVLPDTLIRPLAAAKTYFWRLAVYDLFNDSAVLSDTFKTRAAYAPCPAGMALVENDSIRSGICIDSFEVTRRSYDSVMAVSPPSVSRLPKTGIRPDSAMVFCNRTGSRNLCNSIHLEAAIRQYDGRKYPYGNVYSPDSCNTAFANAFSGGAEVVGNRPGCIDDFGIYDLSGNVAEWVVRYDNDAILYNRGWYSYHVGGFWASGANSGWSDNFDKDTTYTLTQPFIGFRCCAVPTK